MASFFKDNDDLLYYFERGLDWEPLVRLTELDYRAESGFANVDEATTFYREVAEMVGQFVANEIAPHAAEIDREGVSLEGGEVVFPPRLQRIFDRIQQLDLHGLCAPRELGGMNAPLLLYFITTELMARADVSVMAHHGFHGGMAMAMLMFSIREGSTKIDRDAARIVETRWQKEIAEILRGDAWGCMDITEPHAGSDMAQLRTVGEQDADGNWFVTGEKIFITSGHGKYHFVIARTEKPEEETKHRPQGGGSAPGGVAAAGGRGDSERQRAKGRGPRTTQENDDPFAGLGGLSMFLVPTYEEDENGKRRRIVQVSRIEEKLGHHGSATCALVFDRAPAQLVGKRGDGFKRMLTLMNGARLGVGFESIGLCEAAYRAALAYAEERPSMGKTIDRHELIADYLDEMRTDIQGLRALAMHGAVHEEMAAKLELGATFGGTAEMSPEALGREARRHRHRSRRATPLLKYLAAEKAVEMARRCVQIHGGNGYMKEYPAEKLLRDAMVMPIYEGTSQIQSLMAMKDALGGIMKNPQRFVRRMAQARWRSLSARDPLDRRVAKVQLLSLGAQQYLMARTAGDKIASLRDKPVTEWPERFLSQWNPKRDFAHAMLHAERLTRILADEHIVEILLDQARRHPDRRDILERYLDRAEPRCRFLHEEITTTGGRLLAGLRIRDDAEETLAAE